MIRVGIVGISGYTGREVLDICLKHPQIRVTYAAASNTTGPVTEIWPDLVGRTELVSKVYNEREAIKQCDIVFLALPHTQSMAVVPGLLKAGRRVIDLSADYRLSKASAYKAAYNTEHSDGRRLRQVVYGLPELFRVHIRKASFIANPGCYPTAALLALSPLVATYPELIQHIIIDAKSGVSGAGKKVNADLMFSEANENFKAYKVLSHQHAPEINQYLSRLSETDIAVDFVAHLLPITRGILETIYLRLAEPVSLSEVHKFYMKFYKTEPFVHVLPVGTQPELKHVTRTNFCHLGFALSADKKTLVITSVIDNLVKGAAGQAVQNMNIMYGFNETEGLL